MRLLLIFLLFTSTYTSAEIYKTRNPDGSITYTDIESSDSTVITPPKLISTPGFKPKPAPAKKADEDKNKPLPYRLFSITTPANQSVINNNNGQITVNLTIKPALQTHFKHSITLLLDGKPTQTGLKSLTAKLNNIDRGSHTLSAQIIGQYKKILKTSTPVTFHMKRHSILHKKPALPF